MVVDELLGAGPYELFAGGPDIFALVGGAGLMAGGGPGWFCCASSVAGNFRKYAGNALCLMSVVYAWFQACGWGLIASAAGARAGLALCFGSGFLIKET